jgi:hypothetical protein
LSSTPFKYSCSMMPPAFFCRRLSYLLRNEQPWRGVHHKNAISGFKATVLL